MGATIHHNLSLAIITFAICIYNISKLWVSFRSVKNTGRKQFNPAPFYLVCIPIAVVLIRWMFIIPATDFSRNHAIRQSGQLINDIELYFNRTGHYPVSLLSVWGDYDPSVRGIDRFHYELNGKAYNLYFEQFSHEIGVIEIVMYNKLNEHEMTSHNMDLLQIAPENIRRGYHVVGDLPIPHWKYFWFD